MLKEQQMAVARKKKATAKKKPVRRTTTRKKVVAKKATAKKKPATKRAAAIKKTARKKTTARRAAARKAPAKRKPARKKTATKRKPSAAFMRPWTLSEALGAVVGMKPIPRTEVTKRLWDYIKKNKLQDTVNRRMINADEKLRKVFGGKSKVSMFEMTKLVSKHLK